VTGWRADKNTRPGSTSLVTLSMDTRSEASGGSGGGSFSGG